ncbi:helix-turn-helix domain-containing protein [Paenibacillus hemerocallicola]|uniref:Helix-turn-helix domain-containing protein n=1 Tax=Paenibacillus hemerocallicola TaxID=1172614 RepID=A0A5C4T7J1_9BACL|nr:ABC transporter substrate-binding protein [Paenibacillus hemerocallicola]TNJ64815.1 helix-turn-helix domain-containing protein [Paenibacillus hemerocallicola]
MNLHDHLLLWNHASVRLMDIRYTRMENGEELRAYRLPASVFLYATRGGAQVWLDGVPHTAQRFHVFHGGKGLCLDIRAKECFEYYMILYKATASLPGKQEIVRIMDTNNPFQMQFGFAPHYPIALLDIVERMNKQWGLAGLLEKLQVKTLFHQFIYELMWQLDNQRIESSKPDPVGQAVRYMHQQYGQPITLESLADMLDCNTRQFLRMFKSRHNTSPIDYLTHVRLTRAKELLLQTDCTLKEIAESVGYSDSYYFSRVFKKYEGVSPTSFKEKARKPGWSRKNPSYVSTSPIAAGKLRRYIGNDFDNRYQYNKKGDLPMRRRTGTSMAATLLFCFALLLSACTTGTTTSNGVNGGSANAEATSPAAKASTATESARVIKHAMGETTLIGTPKRVVILTNEGTEALLAVGVKPVGAVQSWIGSPWYDHIKDEMKDVSVVGDELQPNIELIAGLKPDLIIGNKARQEKVYEQLKQIAPTVFAEDLGGDWQINFKLYMEAINKKEEGDKTMAAFDKRVSEVKAKLGAKTATKVSVARFSATQVRIYQKQSFSGVLLNQLGIARPASQDKESFIEVMSKEKIPSMDGDVLFYFVTEAAGKTDAAKVVQEWMNDPLFKNLSVYKNKKVIQVDEAIWNSAGGYKAANLLLDELAAYFEVK